MGCVILDDAAGCGRRPPCPWEEATRRRQSNRHAASIRYRFTVPLLGILTSVQVVCSLLRPIVASRHGHGRDLWTAQLGSATVRTLTWVSPVTYMSSPSEISTSPGPTRICAGQEILMAASIWIHGKSFGIGVFLSSHEVFSYLSGST